MLRTFSTLTAITALSVTTCLPASAQSFNCRYAKTPDEVAICGDPRLSQLDERMSRRFFTLRNELIPPEQVRLDDTQGQWLARRGSCGDDPACIEEAYLTRIDQLANW
jgi:uncharacterized protein